MESTTWRFCLQLCGFYFYDLRSGGSQDLYESSNVEALNVEILSTFLRLYNVEAICVEVHSTVPRRGGSQDQSKRKFPYLKRSLFIDLQFWSSH